MSKLRLYDDICHVEASFEYVGHPTSANEARKAFVNNVYERAHNYLYRDLDVSAEPVTNGDVEMVLKEAENQLLAELNPFVLAKRQMGHYSSLGIRGKDRKLAYSALLEGVKDKLEGAKEYLTEKQQYDMQYYGALLQKLSRNLRAVDKAIAKRTHLSSERDL